MEVSALSLADRIRLLIEQGEIQLPVQPELAMKLERALGDEDADLRRVAEWIQAEPAVAAALLKAANSVMYGGLKPISDLPQAIARLGIPQVRTLALGTLLRGQFRATDPEQERSMLVLWNHAVASAAVARNLARREGAESEEAFVAGLLHGIGRLLTVRALEHLVRIEPEVSPTPSVVEELVDAMQFDLGYRTLRSWNLSEDICDAARILDPDLDLPPRLTLTIVQAADLIAQKMGLHPHPDGELNLLDQDAIERLELHDVELAALMVDLEDEIDQMRELL